MKSKDIKSHTKQVLRQFIDPTSLMFKFAVKNLRDYLYSRVNLTLEEVKERMRHIGLFDAIVNKTDQHNVAVGLFKVYEVRTGERLIPVDMRKMRKNSHKKHESSNERVVHASTNCTDAASCRYQTSMRSLSHNESKNCSDQLSTRSLRYNPRKKRVSNL